MFARAVNDDDDHLVGGRKLTITKWGDRLLDAKLTGYGCWEATANHTGAAINLMPNHLVVCEWHYDSCVSAPSEHLFQGIGFRVWTARWKNKKAALAPCNAAERMVEHLATTWSVTAPKSVNAVRACLKAAAP